MTRLERNLLFGDSVVGSRVGTFLTVLKYQWKGAGTLVGRFYLFVLRGFLKVGALCPPVQEFGGPQFGGNLRGIRDGVESVLPWKG